MGEEIGRSETRVTLPDAVVGYIAVLEGQLTGLSRLIDEGLGQLGYSKRIYDPAGVAYFLAEAIRGEPVMLDTLKIKVPDVPEYESHGVRVVLRPNCPNDVGASVHAAMAAVGINPQKAEVELDKDGIIYGFVSLHMHRSS